MTLPQLADFEVDGLQVRAAPAKDWELSDDGQFVGRAVPYDVEAELFPGLFESVARGAFAAQVKDPARVKICYRHGDVIGRAVQLEDREDGLWVRGQIIAHEDRPLARQAIQDLRDKLIDELSIGFQDVKDGTEVTEDSKGVHVRHNRAALREISVVPFGAFGRKAKVSKVRDEDSGARDARIVLLASQILAIRL